ncbi:MAG: nucleotidyltransferase domain-containing protein [Gammaproteobacteria bacterium]|nr:nucleotidyltransferase domain-containing protein [Gammaproteobacteria bacterium]
MRFTGRSPVPRGAPYDVLATWSGRFGSHAKNTERIGSDVDLVIVTGLEGNRTQQLRRARQLQSRLQVGGGHEHRRGSPLSFVP